MTAPASETNADLSAPIGVDRDRVIPWLTERCDWITPPLTWTKLAGGHSNFTYLVNDSAGNAFVLRRPPLGELLPSAHDMGREFKVMSALSKTAVPVPEPLAMCTDKEVTGANFYVMRAVDGISLYNAEEAEALVPEGLRRDHGFHFIDVLADLHAIDPEAIGLGDLGRPDAYVGRQLKRWKASWDASKTCDRPDVDRLHTYLSECMPTQGPARVVHGDYGLHNCVSNSAGRIAAVIDWEISTLGDSLADLAYAINAWGKRGENSGRGIKPSLAVGYPTDTELLDRYATRTGVDLSNINFYVSFNHWKTTCIIDGVLARYFHGQKSTEGVDIAGLEAGRDEALAKSIEAARDLGY
jgi:aminoglycoside phosphotransferase (APT) family kinase protein